jgi:hypothetical protein
MTRLNVGLPNIRDAEVSARYKTRRSEFKATPQIRRIAAANLFASRRCLIGLIRTGSRQPCKSSHPN